MGRPIAPESIVPGMVAMALWFTASAVGPLVTPWERRAKTYERLVSSPASLQAILAGDVVSGLVFGTCLSVIPIVLGLALTNAQVTSTLLLVSGRRAAGGPSGEQPVQHHVAVQPGAPATPVRQWRIHAHRPDAVLGTLDLAHLATFLRRRSHPARPWAESLLPGQAKPGRAPRVRGRPVLGRLPVSSPPAGQGAVSPIAAQGTGGTVGTRHGLRR